MGSTTAFARADALLDAESMGSPVHVESPDSDCAIHHDHLFCQVVRSLFQTATTRDIPALATPAPPIRVLDADPEAHDAKCAAILFGSVVPRGPPVS